MKFSNLIYKILEEEVKDKQRFNNLYNKWKSEDNNLSLELAEFLFNKHLERKNGLKPTNPSVLTFLNRYNGDTNKYEKFAPQVDRNNILDVEKSLQRIENFSLEQLKFLIGEFYDLPYQENKEEETIKRIASKDQSPTPEIVERSKELWYGKRNLLVDEGTFRVYSIDDVMSSIEFGYYVGHLVTTGPYRGRSQWCVTRYKIDSNLYSNYRNNRTFYFVIDETKHPDVDSTANNQYYLSALQFATDTVGNEKFRITSLYNPGEPVITDQDLLKLYPKLQGHLNKIVPKEWNRDREMGGDDDPINMINENLGSPFEFSKQSREYKKEYISRGRPIRKEISWKTLNDDLKQAYIDVTTDRNFNERFSYELISIILKNNQDSGRFKRRLSIIGLNFADVISKFIESEFAEIMFNIKNKNVKLYQSRSNKYFGLFNLDMGDFLTSGGIQYTPNYKQTMTKVLVDDTGKDFVLTVFSTGTQIDNNSFFSLLEQKSYDESKPKPSYFMSKNKYDELMESGKMLEPDEELSIYSGGDVESDSDIQELY